ncbi:rhodanese-like domain-containing protein [Agromyces bauzanensis]
MADITIAQVRERLGGADQLIDVREIHEVAEGMVPGARNIPLGTLPSRLGEIDRSRPVIAICRSGNRSRQATEVLKTAGFRVDNMEGGMIAWSRAGLPVSR